MWRIRNDHHITAKPGIVRVEYAPLYKFHCAGMGIDPAQEGTEAYSCICFCKTSVRLNYRTRWRSGEWQDINELIPFVETATNFGGWRRWFKCLSCKRRCRILYGGSHFWCRRCWGLKYDSQYEPGFGRAARKAQRIRERLTGHSNLIDDPFPPKPKSMQGSTYRRLEAEDERLRQRWSWGVRRDATCGKIKH
jgi:hypothetical protein